MSGEDVALAGAAGHVILPFAVEAPPKAGYLVSPMKKITLTHEINCGVDEFWEIFFDQEFNQKLFKDHLDFPEYEVLEQEERDGGMYRKLRGRPKMDVPKPVAKALGDKFGYEETGHKKGDTWEWSMKTNTLTDKLHTRGTVRCEKISDDKCRRVAEIEMEAKVFGIGKLIEQSTEKEMRDGWNKSAAFMNQWIAQKKG
jgi:hypothetical protein